jgi:ppGpp synthetase/RelA/SpoT-type nucleotidyltranferase
VSELQTARTRWQSERSNYEILARHVVTTIEKALRSQGMFAHVTWRVKDMASLLKKLLKKGYGYDQVTDKAGVRVVVRFRHEIEAALRLVESSFNIVKKEDKSEKLGHNQVGYSGVHYDVRLQSLTRDQEVAGLATLQCEIQVHSLGQNLWAELDHELAYKPVQPVPDDLRRQIYLLNALLEVVDRNFDSISLEISKLPGADAMRLLQSLERHFYRFTGENFDSELSLQILDHVLSCYDSDELSKIPSIIEDFVESNAARLEFMFDQYEGIDSRPLLLFQPETFVLLERLGKTPHFLEEVWTKTYPREELERLSIVWGTPLD